MWFTGCTKSTVITFGGVKKGKSFLSQISICSGSFYANIYVSKNNYQNYSYLLRNAEYWSSCNSHFSYFIWQFCNYIWKIRAFLNAIVNRMGWQRSWWAFYKSKRVSIVLDPVKIFFGIVCWFILASNPVIIADILQHLEHIFEIHFASGIWLISMRTLGNLN